MERITETVSKQHTKKRSKSNHFCCVPQCTTYYSENISMHYFPRDIKLRNKWQVVLRIRKAVSNHMVVCSKHFLQSDFFLPGKKMDILI